MTKLLSDRMYSFNANLSLYNALKKDEEAMKLNKIIGEWIKEVRELEARIQVKEAIELYKAKYKKSQDVQDCLRKMSIFLGIGVNK